MASISSPSSLASFSSSHASSSKRPHVVLSPVEGREDGQAVAAVRGDGIWTYDLASLGATTSFTVPPSTIFSTAPISFYPPVRFGSSKSSGKQKADSENAGESSHGERYTAVAVLEGEKIKKEEQGRVIWVWKGEEGSKIAITLDHVVQAVHHIPHHRALILAVHQDGHLTALDSALHTRPISVPSLGLNDVMASRVLSTHGDKVRITLVAKSGEVAIVELDVGGPREISGQIVKQGKISGKAEIATADISEDGSITATTTHRRQGLISRSIKNLTDKTDSIPILLHALSTPHLTLPTSGRPISLLAISEPEPTLVLASLSSGVPAVVTSHSLASLAPSAQATIVSLSLISHQAPYVIAVGVSYKNEEATRTTIYTLEISLPVKGIGMNILLGTQAETARWFQLTQGGNNNSPFDKFITSLKAAVTSGTALKVVEGWVQTHNYGLDNSMSEAQAKGILAAVFGAALTDGEVTGTYVKEVVTLLLDKRWVHDDMYPGGVLSALITLSDWENASKAVRTIPTIPSSATVDFVKKAIHLIDSPALQSVLHDVLISPSPAPDYRAALRSGLTVEEATEMLVIYAKWLEGHVERKGEGLSGWSDDKRPKDVKGNKKSSAQVVVSFEELPSLEAIIAYSSALLDSHLPLFLSHPPSFDPLQSLQESLTPLLAMQESYRRLRAPVEAVLTLSRREAKKREEREARQKGSKGKKTESSGAGLPDEAVGKWRVEQFVF